MVVSYEQFSQCDLRVVTILSCERIEGSDKLLKLRVAMHTEETEERQVIAGIGKWYAPEELNGKQVCIIANLEPRTLMGHESQGMLLATDDTEGKPVLLLPEHSVQPGAKIH